MRKTDTLKLTLNTMFIVLVKHRLLLLVTNCYQYHGGSHINKVTLKCICTSVLYNYYDCMVTSKWLSLCLTLSSTLTMSMDPTGPLTSLLTKTCSRRQASWPLEACSWRQVSWPLETCSWTLDPWNLVPWADVKASLYLHFTFTIFTLKEFAC